MNMEIPDAAYHIDLEYKKGLVRDIDAAGSDNHEYFGGTWTGGYHIQQDPEEFADLLLALDRVGGVNSYLQIGIAAGGAERVLCEYLQPSSLERLTVMDDGRHPNNRVWRTQNKLAIELAEIRVTEFVGNSHGNEAIRFLTEEHPDSLYDLIGIDGDHSPAGVRMDWALVQPFIRAGTLVFLHDIKIAIAGETGARELWEKLKVDPAFEVMLETDGKFGIGLVRKK